MKMMGRMVRAGVGYTPQQGVQTAGSGLMTAAPFTGPAAPFVAAAGALVSLFGKLFSFGYNPRKLNDTQITEAVQLSLHNLWYPLTGEDLGGVQNPCEPGKCGGHTAIFTTSAYPNIPKGAAGDPNVDVNQLLQGAQSVIAQGRNALIRKESFADYDANTGYLMGLFQQVAQARAQTGRVADVLSIPQDWTKILLWGIGGLAVYSIL